MYARGDWQRPSWQGRSVVGSMAGSADDLFIGCLLVERQGKSANGVAKGKPGQEKGARDSKDGQQGQS